MAAGIDLHPTRPMSFEPLDTGPDQDVGRLLVTCEDRPGICAAICGYLAGHGANITNLQQYTTDPSGGRLFVRVEFLLPGLDEREPGGQRGVPAAGRLARDGLAAGPGGGHQAAGDHGVQGRPRAAGAALAAQGRRPARRDRHGDLQPRGPAPAGGDLGHPVPLRAGDAGDQAGGRGGSSSTCCAGRSTRSCWPATCRCSRRRSSAAFPMPGDQHPPQLPAGVRRRRPVPEGGRARGQADRGDGALRDRGPGRRADHRAGRRPHRPPRQSVADLRRAGRYVERAVLARAVGWHVEDRVIVHGNKTIVFN